MEAPVQREVTIAAAPKMVWAALTDPGELASWFGAEVDIDLRPGGNVHFRWPDGAERRGLVVDLDPPYRLAFRWRELRTTDTGLVSTDASVVTFVLEPDGDGTRVTVTESPGVAADLPRAMAETPR